MNFTEIYNNENALVSGDKVIVRWTNSHQYYRAKATVTKLNKASVNVTLDEGTGPYNIGNKLRIPRFTVNTMTNGTWSANNQIERKI